MKCNKNAESHQEIKMKKAMRGILIFLMPVLIIGATLAPRITVLIDLDPNSAAQTVIVESIAADSHGLLYVCDRVSGNVWRIDPRKPKLVVVGQVESREIQGRKVNADASGLAFNQEGDLFIASGPFSEVLRIRSRDLDPDKPGTTQTFARYTEGANGVAVDKNGNLYVSGGRNGKIYRTGREGGKADVIAQVATHTRILPDGKTQQAITANGIVFDAEGTTLYVADTARGAIWRVPIANAAAGQPTLLAQSALLEGADGPAFDPRGKLWVEANERTAIVIVTSDSNGFDIAKNGSKVPLYLPHPDAVVEGTAYVSNFDTPRGDNL